MAESMSTNITIEPCLEGSVYEYSFDGEKIKSTQSMSDHFTKTLSRMRLHDICADDSTETSNDEEQRLANGNKNSFATFFEQMRQAYVEICGLHDVLSLTLTRHYFTLSPNACDIEEQLNSANRQQRDFVLRQNQDMIQKTWISKKTSARQAADVLLLSYERFMKIINTTSGNSENFHVQLSNLRQRWKIRKHTKTNQYLGDLSFRSAGSFYACKMQFEVTKADSHKRTQNNSIDVLIPEELQVRVLLKIDIETKDGQVLLRSYSTMMANDTINTNLQDNNFDIILENAQRTAFLKELFSQLCREASDITNIIQPTVMRNSIRCWILPDVVMTISLLRITEFDPENNQNSNLIGAHVGLLENALCALLRQQYLRNFHYSQLKPSTLMLGVPALRRIAGVNAFNFNQLKSISENKSILQTIIELSQHQIIRARILDLLNKLSTNCDINMTVNISSFSSNTSTYGRVHFVAPGYDNLCRWSYMFQIENCEIKIQYKTHLIEFRYHIEEIQRFFINQIAHFKFTVACAIAKIFDWTIVGSTMAPVVGGLTEIQFSAQFDHSKISSSIGIRIGDDLELQTAIRTRQHNHETMMDDDSNERSKGMKYDPVNLDDYCGTSTLQKFEMFVSSLLFKQKQQ